MTDRGARTSNRHRRPSRLTVGLAIAGAVFVGLLIASVGAVSSLVDGVAAPSASVAVDDPPAGSTLKAVFIGDSFTAGFGATHDSRSFVEIVGRAQGWHVDNLGLGGTGYSRNVADDAYFSCELDYCPNYDEVIPDAVTLDPDVIVVSGGVNDLGTNDLAEGVLIEKFYRDLRAAFPDATIYATSPVPDGDGPADDLVGMEDAVRTSVTAVGGTYLDIGEPLMDRPDLIAMDQVHPNDAGHAALAAAILAALDAARSSVG